jgi:Mn-containing catalase
VHQVAYARALELLTGADLTKMFPTPRIPTDKIPECQPHIQRGDHLRLYRFSPTDYHELAAVWRGPHPETGEDLVVIEEPPEGAPAHDLPDEPAVFASDYAPEEIAEIAQRLREQAGLPEIPTGQVASTPDGGGGTARKTAAKKASGAKTPARKRTAKAKK